MSKKAKKLKYLQKLKEQEQMRLQALEAERKNKTEKTSIQPEVQIKSSGSGKEFRKLIDQEKDPDKVLFLIVLIFLLVFILTPADILNKISMMLNQIIVIK